mmetsp:Transcript_67397/g.186574  ORF Transcript_67397/g.186574 Transcript_67397/m.186574 type:complete len:319 (+) Transcript_67397:1-957(+)
MMGRSSGFCVELSATRRDRRVSAQQPDPLLDEAGNLGRREAPGVDVAVGLEDPFHGPVVGADEHDPAVIALHEDLLDRPELDAAPFLALVVAADEDDDQLGAIAVEVLQQVVQRRTGQLRHVVVVVEVGVGPEAPFQLGGHRFHRRSGFPGERQADVEHMGGDVDCSRDVADPGRQRDAGGPQLLGQVDLLDRPMGAVQFPLADVQLEGVRDEVLGRQEGLHSLQLVFQAHLALALGDVGQHAKLGRRAARGLIREDAGELLQLVDRPSVQRFELAADFLVGVLAHAARRLDGPGAAVPGPVSARYQQVVHALPMSLT